MGNTGKNESLIWASQAHAVIDTTPDCCVQRVIVIESTPSTMDRAGSGEANGIGVLVVALKQTAGRGQRGRCWDDGDEQTLPCTFEIDVSNIESVALSTLVACAVHQTLLEAMPKSIRVMMKWPNDIVVRDDDWTHDRKLAGILIERLGDRASIGIGINCTQQSEDWSADNQGRAASLAELGADVSRLDLLCKLIERLSEWLNTNDREMIQNHFKAHDAMIGKQRSFRIGDRQYTGVVEMIEPFDYIALRTASGLQRLPIAQTQHIRDQDS